MTLPVRYEIREPDEAKKETGEPQCQRHASKGEVMRG